MPPGRVSWHSKVDVALDQLHEYPQRYRNNPSHIAVDECMTEATGRPPDTYGIPSLLDRALSFTVLQTMDLDGKD